MSKRHNGKVVAIRLSTKDILSVYGVIVTAKLLPEDYTLPQAVSLTLHMLLDAVRRTQGIPEVSEFEYLNVIQSFKVGTKRTEQLNIPVYINPPDRLTEEEETVINMQNRITHLMLMKIGDVPGWKDMMQEELDSLSARIADLPPSGWQR